MKEYLELIISRHDDEERYVVECDDIPLELFSSRSLKQCLEYIQNNYRSISEHWELFKKREKEKVHQCIDPEMRYCQGCKYGHIMFPPWIETYEDTQDCTFETKCMLGFDKNEFY